MDEHEKNRSHIRRVMPGFGTLRGVFKPGLWSHLAHLEALQELTIESLKWVPATDFLRVKLTFRGEPMDIFTDWEMCPYLSGEPSTPASLVDTVADHMERCEMKGPVTIARMRRKLSRKRT